MQSILIGSMVRGMNLSWNFIPEQGKAPFGFVYFQCK